MGLAFTLLGVLTVYAGGITLAFRLLRRGGFGWGQAVAFVALALAPFLLFPALGGLSAVWTYDGFCYGFTDGRAPCAFLTYVLLQADAAFLFSLFWNAVYCVVVFGIGAAAWVSHLGRDA